jgi:two-component system nitrate/nitrite response regulator NarL
MRNLPLNVLVADDHCLFRQGLISLMQTRRDLVTVVGEAETCHATLSLTQIQQPDVLLMDILMPDGDGLQVALQVHKCLPHVAVIILTASERDEHVYRAAQAGVVGYLLKSLDAAELFDLLYAVAHGEPVLTQAMAARLLKRTAATVGQEDLTEREIEVLRLVVQGNSNPQIAETLGITTNTVKVHLRNILAKLQVENRIQAAAYAVRSGLVQHRL